LQSSFALFAFAVPACGRAVSGADGRRLIESTIPVATAAAVDDAEFDSLAALTLAVAARGQAVLGAATAVRTGFVIAAYAVAAGPTIDRATEGALDVEALAISAPTVAFGVVGPGNAVPGQAVVLYGARVVIVTQRPIVARVVDTAILLARIHGARVKVVTVHGEPDALARFAVIVIGAGIAVVAIGSGEWLMVTAFTTGAGIGGALVTVITVVCLIEQAVTVVVDSVAELLGRTPCIALIHAARPADPPPGARAEIVGKGALRSQGVGEGVLGAFTRIRCHALGVDRSFR